MLKKEEKRISLHYVLSTMYASQEVEKLHTLKLRIFCTLTSEKDFFFLQ